MSGSTFDQIDEEECQQINVEDVDFFSVVTDLYAQYRSHNPQIRGTAVRHGQVEETQLDFCISVECALKNTCTPRECTLFVCFAAHGLEAINKCLPRTVKEQLQVPFKAIYFGFPQLVKAAFHARDVQQRSDARKAKREAERAELEAQRILTAV